MVVVAAGITVENRKTELSKRPPAKAGGFLSRADLTSH
jgi:hypothetical protein